MGRENYMKNRFGNYDPNQGEPYYMQRIDDVSATLRSLGIGGKYHGFRYLAMGVALVIENQDRLLNATKEIYEPIADRYRTTWYAVERNMRTALKVCWAYGNRALLFEIAGYELVTRPTNVEFLDIVAARFLLENHPG